MTYQETLEEIDKHDESNLEAIRREEINRKNVTAITKALINGFTPRPMNKRFFKIAGQMYQSEYLPLAEKLKDAWENPPVT